MGTAVRRLRTHREGVAQYLRHGVAESRRVGSRTGGQDLVVRVAIKPTSSIRIPRQTLTKDLQETEVVTKGRHDPCVGLRGVPVVEAMMALTLADHFLLNRAQCG